MRTIAVVNPPGIVGTAHIEDNNPVPGQTLQLSPSGITNFQVSDLYYSALHILAEGYHPYHRPIELPLGNKQLRVGIDDDPNYPDDIVLDPLEPISTLVMPQIVGRKLVPYVRGIDQFRAFEWGLAGRDLTPLVKQTKELKANFWRVFFSYQTDEQGRGIGRLNPRYTAFYDQLRAFVQWANKNGIGVIAVCFADAQRIWQPNELGAMQTHWSEFNNALSGLVVIRDKVNEWTKNLPNNIHPLQIGTGTDLWSHGSDQGDGAPVRPEATINMFHGVRHLPTMLNDAVASIVELHDVQGYQNPIIADEPARFDMTERGFGYKLGLDAAIQLAGRYATLLGVEWGGSVFHCEEGLQSMPMGEETFRMAKAWFGALDRHVN